MARWSRERHGIFSRTDALCLGATLAMIRSRVAGGRWQELYPGIYCFAGGPHTRRRALLAAVLSLGSESVASHRSAAGLRSIAGFEREILEASVIRGRRRPRAGIVIHEVESLPSVDVEIVDAIPVTTVTRTLIDLGAVVPIEQLEEALDDALRRNLTTVPRLRWRVSELAIRGRRGIGKIRRLLDASEPGARPHSVLETRFARLLRRAPLPVPVRQYEIRERGRLLAIPDFAYPEHKVAIEVDGYRWHSGRARWEHDLARRNRLTSRGWLVIHVTDRDIEQRPGQVASTIAAALARPQPR
jgi:hypothetical protein